MAKKAQPAIEKGNISVSTENIFPIIKKSLYSDHEIFLRELVANAMDASQKIKYLASIGEFKKELGELKITVTVDKEARTLSITDHGIGMSADEVKKYINQVAFSGAEEFVKKFKDVDQNEDIIGKFGLGFYSAFMVADTVEIISRSYKRGKKGVRWTCDGSTSYTLEQAERKERGTDVILHISEDSDEFLEPLRIRNILNKYCKFLPIEIEFEGEVINKTKPIWKKAPSELEDEDYINFYKELYPMSEEPLFWIHLNIDYPFELTGILFFPRIRKDIDPGRNKIQLYSRQVFITDEIKDIVPEYLMLLQGVIDSPDIPLNVSRSYLQSDSNVKKISGYITKKVADKLHAIYKDDKEGFAEKWDDISVFVKYGMLTDEKFYDKAEKFCLLKNTEGETATLEDYREKISPNQTDKEEQLVYLYATDAQKQDMFVEAAKANKYDVLNMDGPLDSHFIALLERKAEKTRWARVDADTLDKLIPKTDAEEKEDLDPKALDKIVKAFESVIAEKNMQVSTEQLGAEQMPLLITRPEFIRRMKEMQASGGMSMMGEMPESLQVIVNTDHPLVQKMPRSTKKEKLARQLLDLGLLSQNMLTGKELTDFIKRSISLISK